MFNLPFPPPLLWLRWYKKKPAAGGEERGCWSFQLHCCIIMEDDDDDDDDDGIYEMGDVW